MEDAWACESPCDLIDEIGTDSGREGPSPSGSLNSDPVALVSRRGGAVRILYWDLGLLCTLSGIDSVYVAVSSSPGYAGVDMIRCQAFLAITSSRGRAASLCCEVESTSRAEVDGCS